MGKVGRWFKNEAAAQRQVAAEVFHEKMSDPSRYKDVIKELEEIARRILRNDGKTDHTRQAKHGITLTYKHRGVHIRLKVNQDEEKDKMKGVKALLQAHNISSQVTCGGKELIVELGNVVKELDI